MVKVKKIKEQKVKRKARKENSYVKPTKIVKVRKTLIYEIKTCTKEIYCSRTKKKQIH